jgi:outer membrane protein OmpA-like peptidoglycan-associated protein
VLDIRVIPLVFKTGYVFSLGQFNITPLLGAGQVFVTAEHYETAIAMLQERKSRSSGTGFFGAAGLRLGWTFIPALTLFAGAGIDCVFETDGPIPFPAVELGVTVKPFLFGKSARPPKPAARPAAEPPPVPAESAPPAAASQAEPAVPEAPPAPDPSVIEPSAGVLYFPPDSAVPAAPAALDGAGELLRANPALTVTLRGYAAPHGTPAGQRALSEARARFCADYLRGEYGIAAERITVEWYGADRVPEAGPGGQPEGAEGRRCVEILIEPLPGLGTGPES